MIDLARVLRTVVDALEQVDAGYVVVGSVAADVDDLLGQVPPGRRG